MSRLRFEELIDALSGALLTVDFGTPKSLADSRLRLEAVIEFLDQSNRHDLAEPARALLDVLRPNPAQGRISAQRKRAIADQVEQLAQLWYEAAKRWSSGAPSKCSEQALQLSEVADASLLAEFILETRLKAEDLQTHIEQLRAGSINAVAEVRRMIHTIKGESGMLGLQELARLLHGLESHLEQPAATWNRAEELQLVHDWMLQALGTYERGHLPKLPSELAWAIGSTEPSIGQATGPTETSLAWPPAKSTDPTSLGSPTPTLPVKGFHSERSDADVSDLQPASADVRIETSSTEPEQDSTSWDAEEIDLVVEFLHESAEATALIDQTLLEIEQLGPDSERVNKLFRTFHSLKGVASFLHMGQIVELTHTTETMLDQLRSGRLSPEIGIVDLVFDATALLRKLIGAVQVALNSAAPLATVPGTDDLIDKIRRTTHGQAPQGSMLPAEPGSKLGEILVENRALSNSQLNFALERQKESGRKLGEELVAEGVVPAKVIAQALRGQDAASGQNTKTKEVVKVDLERVDSLVATIGELVIVESMVSNAPEIRGLPTYVRNYLGQFAKITRELQEVGMRMRMVPLRSEFQKMARMVRDLARRSNKRVHLELRGEQTEMDRSMVEQIADPLVHLIRNAVDHGIETPEERTAQGKSETAAVVLSACHEGGSIVIEISDDGRGIDRERIVAKATAQGLINEGANLSDSQIYDLLFLPGFSTASQVTEISGRGVGMDVVKRNIEAIRGRIVTRSAKGRGTSFRLVLPLTLAIIDGMVIRSGNERFIVPTLNIVESLQPTRRMLFSIASTNEHILVRGQTLPLLRLGNILGVQDQEQDPTKALVIIVESMHTRVAVLVDEVVMKHQVVIKTLGHELGVNHLFAGAAILSNGHVGLIMNIEALVESALSRVETRAAVLA